MVGVEAGEMMVRLDADARLDGGHQVLGVHLLGPAVAFDSDTRVAADELGVAQAREGLFEVVLEDIRHAGELDVLVAGEQVHHGLRAASATTHQAGLQPVVAWGGARHARLEDGEGGHAGAEKARFGEQAPAGNTIRILHDSTVSQRGRAEAITPAEGRRIRWPAGSHWS